MRATTPRIALEQEIAWNAAVKFRYLKAQFTLRIAQIAPLAEAVPPKRYGGTERVVSWLIEELVDLGCCVTLFASGDSVTSGTLASAWPHALWLIRGGVNEAAAYSSLLESIAAQANDFDVIHAHLDWIHLPLLSRLDVPFITTLHGRLDLANLAIMANRFPHASFVSISDNQRSPLPNLNWVGTARREPVLSGTN